MSLAEPRLLCPVLQDYAWGSPTAIARIRGVEPTGEPQAELWFGAHANAPSTVDGRPLDQLIAAEPAVVGTASVERFGPGLPYLIKILAADRPLSLQAHPSREQAEAGFARDEAEGLPRDAARRRYKDSWPKPEMLVALEPTEALCGFREATTTADLLDRFGVPALTELIAPLRADPVEGIRQTFLRFLGLDGDERRLVDVVVEAAQAPVADPGSAFAQVCATAVELAAAYPGDPGVLAALLMNRVAIEPYAGVFLPAGNLHAYLHGVGVEIMANSDNVLRGGLTPKHVDLAELSSIVDFAPGFPGIVEAEPVGPGVWRYRTPAPEFALWRLDADARDLPAADAGRIVLAIDAVTLTADDIVLDVGPGEGAFVPAGVTCAAAATGVAFVAAPGC